MWCSISRRTHEGIQIPYLRYPNFLPNWNTKRLFRLYTLLHRRLNRKRNTQRRLRLKSFLRLLNRRRCLRRRLLALLLDRLLLLLNLLFLPRLLETTFFQRRPIFSLTLRPILSFLVTRRYLTRRDLPTLLTYLHLLPIRTRIFRLILRITFLPILTIPRMHLRGRNHKRPANQ